VPAPRGSSLVEIPQLAFLQLRLVLSLWRLLCTCLRRAGIYVCDVNFFMLISGTGKLYCKEGQMPSALLSLGVE
jgi:hypothetical protein